MRCCTRDPEGHLYVTLISPRRTFASVQPTTKRRVDLGLRIEAPVFEGRLESAASIGQSSMTARIGLMSVDEVDDEVDDEVENWLRRAYAESSQAAEPSVDLDRLATTARR